MYLIEEIKFKNVQQFENKLNEIESGEFKVVQIIHFGKGEFDKHDKAIVLFKQKRKRN
jgi:outer membrane lipoprotein-sorting protein